MLAILFASIFLHGCGETARTADKNITFSSGENEAVVVLSLRTNTPDQSVISMFWREFDEASGFFKEGKSQSIRVRRNSTLMWTRTESPLQETRFLVYRVAPGNYALDYHYSGYIGENYTFKLRPTTLAFKVEAGEVIYLGNYLLKSPRGKATFRGKEVDIFKADKTKLEFDGQDIDPVKAFLRQEYPGISTFVVLRRPELAELKLTR